VLVRGPGGCAADELVEHDDYVGADDDRGANDDHREAVDVAGGADVGAGRRGRDAARIHVAGARRERRRQLRR
jgi:hypothetical protein